jgi:acyl-CoA synthetase (AMP-forming)/AMP-acid ligase II
MSPASGHIFPRYVRLSGEVADQAILDALAAAYPNANVAHAFASTEAGVGFDVRDGRAGFPVSLIGDSVGAAELRVVDGSLHIRSTRTASRYLGGNGQLPGADGFVDTGDMVEARGDRYYFIGRREGIINVGGQKVHPEEVEAIINQHPAVRMARVSGRRSPITGAIVIADVVLRAPGPPAAFDAIRAEILEECGRVLPAHKIPTTLREVASIEVTPSGKLARANA